MKTKNKQHNLTFNVSIELDDEEIAYLRKNSFKRAKNTYYDSDVLFRNGNGDILERLINKGILYFYVSHKTFTQVKCTNKVMYNSLIDKLNEKSISGSNN